MPLSPPNVEAATNRGMSHDMKPRVLSANVWKCYIDMWVWDKEKEISTEPPHQINIDENNIHKKLCLWFSVLAAAKAIFKIHDTS